MQDGAITTRSMSCLGVDKYDFKGRKKNSFSSISFAISYFKTINTAQNMASQVHYMDMLSSMTRSTNSNWVRFHPSPSPYCHFLFILNAKKVGYAERRKSIFSLDPKGNEIRRRAVISSTCYLLNTMRWISFRTVSNCCALNNF